MVVHAVAAGQAPAGLVALLYEVADDRDLPDVARGEDGRMAWRMRARHRLREPETPVDRASDEEIVALLGACRSARDRLLVLVMARAGLRRGELCGLRRGDVHLLADSRALGCEVARAHLHVVRRDDNPNRAWAKSRRQRVVPLDFLVVQAFDSYEFERMRVAAAAGSDFVFVNLFRAPVGAPLRPDAVGELLAAASRRAGLDPAIRPHQLRHAFASNVADAGGGIDVVADLLGHASVSSSQVYSHPDPSRLRAAVDAVPSPREQAGAARWTARDRRDGSGDARDDRPPGDDRVAGPARRPERLARVRRHGCPRRTGRPAGRAGRPTVPGRVRLGPGRPGSGPATGSPAAGMDATGRPGPGGDKRDELCGAGLLATAGLARAVPSAPVAPDAARSIGGRVRRRPGAPRPGPVRPLPGRRLPPRPLRRARRLLRAAPDPVDPRPAGQPRARRGPLAAHHLPGRGHRPGEPGRHATIDHRPGALRPATTHPVRSAHPRADAAAGRGGPAPRAGRLRARHGPDTRGRPGEAHAADRAGPAHRARAQRPGNREGQGRVGAGGVRAGGAAEVHHDLAALAAAGGQAVGRRRAPAPPR